MALLLIAGTARGRETQDTTVHLPFERQRLTAGDDPPEPLPATGRLKADQRLRLSWRSDNTTSRGPSQSRAASYPPIQYDRPNMPSSPVF
ncbi:MAG TPA: hypothetical protein PL064_01175, partial [Thermogutta sp.]|nr:hypothetical protein [Thermogutta sp.]